MVVAKKAVRKAPQDRKRKAVELLKLDLGAGQRPAEGFKGVDLANSDYNCDLLAFPWPFKDGSVGEIRCSHFVEHIPHWRPGWDRDGWWMFFDELYRVMAPEATATFIHPYSRSDRAFWDPTHERFIHETTWYYLDRKWRESQLLDHYPVACDFEVVVIDGQGVPDHIVARNMDFQNFARAHYFNVISDLVVTLKKR